MKLIRKNCFETNSSSTHALVIPKKVKEDNYSLYDSLDHNYHFGREECRLCDDWDEKLAYIYIFLKLEEGSLIKDTDIKKFKERTNELYKKAKELDEWACEKPLPNDIFKVIDDDTDYNCYVDHYGELEETGILEKILNDDEFLMRFLFNRDSYITIGGDEFRGYNIKTIGFQYDYDCNGHCVNEKWEEPPEDWFDENGRIKDEYFQKYCKEYPYDNTDFWKKLKEYEKDNDVYLKGN